MANTVQHKRGTTAQVNSYTGAVGEFIYNTTTKRIHAQDGATAGGIPHALVSDVDLKANASVTISAGTGLTGGGTLAANRTLALSSTSIASLALADSAVQSVNGKSGSSITLTKADVGLSNVDNTSDANKPISTATQTALNAKANSSVTITAGTGLTGGGNLTANRSIALNASSIASLVKADTALQAPGGTTGQILAKNSGADNDVAWVTSEAATAVSYGPQTLTEAQQVQARQNIQADKSYDSIASVEAATVPAFANAIRTNGYYEAGDGGGAMYKRVSSEPSHAGKVQSADGAWWEIVSDSEYSLALGVVGDNSTDDAPALNNTLSATRSVVLPKRTIRINSPLIVDNSSMPGDIGSGSAGVTFRGEDRRQSVLSLGPNASTYGLDIIYGTGSQAHAQTVFRDFSIIGATGKTSLHVKNAAFLAMRDITLQSGTRGLHSESVLSSSFENMRFAWAEVGARFDQGTGFSNANALLLSSCVFGHNSEIGFQAYPISNVSMIGGSIENNGTPGITGGGCSLSFTGTQGNVAANFYGVYFEGNRGGYDVRLENTGDEYCTVNFIGCNFTRLHNVNHVLANIACYGKVIVNLIGCTFNRKNSYVASASRPYVTLSGLAQVNAIGCSWSDDIEAGALLTLNQLSEYRGSVASGATSGRLPVGWSVASGGTGVAVITHNLSVASINDYTVLATVTGGDARMIQRIVKGANSCQVVTTNATGVSTDAAFDFQLVLNK